MQTKSNIQLLIEEANRRTKLGDFFEEMSNKYESIEGVFDSNTKEVLKGFMVEGKEYGTIREACNAWEKNQVLHITNEGKYILGEIKPFNECQGKIFDIAILKYITE